MFFFLIYVFSLQAVITLKVINGLYKGVTTVELDNLAAETAATMTTKHPDYAVLAARIAVSNLHKETKKCFSGEWMKDLAVVKKTVMGEYCSLIVFHEPRKLKM